MNAQKKERPDEYWMKEALLLAEKAESMGDVPVGAVIIKDQEIIGHGFNSRESGHSAIAHAEVLAIQNACNLLKTWRLIGCSVFVTLEPCLMCAGAIYQARIQRVVFGAFDPKAGALGSLYKIHEDGRLNHRFMVKGGVLESNCSAILQKFFKSRRDQMER